MGSVTTNSLGEMGRAGGSVISMCHPIGSNGSITLKTIRNWNRSGRVCKAADPLANENDKKKSRNG